ncbi:Beta-lactamase inhibitor (BLIP) [Paenibacillus algorifonticola]|uniref:Beta-lactamase inhibitor (BLIP) n=2 Tax=Paenibacillus algorifonticola TaxID=684063 RepID=A0A1I2HQ30_9BACL|nr:hypothetical protein [Paenibacillus algorifonticola]SFF31949.1 Beta-lactamase inhibitor (BLIP) [Paenibacillus algorifonticola]
MKKYGRRWLGGAALILSLLALSACGSSGPTQADFDSLQERVAGLEQQLAAKEQELEELKSTVVAINQAGGSVDASAPSDNGPADKGDDVRITFDQYQQIEIGMTYKEVTEIVGGNGRALSETADMVVYSYYGAGDTGANAVLSFNKGKLLSKAQAGLD